MIGLCFAVVFLVLGFGCLRPRPTPPATAVPALRQVPIGLCEDYPEETRSLAEVDRDLALVKEVGATVLRVSIGWDDVEPEDNRFEFGFWDEVIARAEKANIRLIPYVAYRPEWAGGGTPEHFWREPPRDPEAFADVMEELARRYRGRIHSWELWNEPDNREYWRGSVAEYAALLRAGAAGVRRGDPAAQIVSGGLAGNVDFLRALFTQDGIGTAVDVVNVHAYYETWNPEPLERLPEYLAEVAAVTALPAPHPIWLAEVGYGTYRRGAEVSPYYRARFAYEHTPGFAAVALVRTLVMAFAVPDVTLVAWYEVKDLIPKVDVIGDVNNRHLGVVSFGYQPKPALASLRFLTGLFARGHRRLPVEVQVSPPAPALEARAFLLAGGAATAFVWIPTNPPGLVVAPSAAGDLADARRANARIGLPCKNATGAELRDEKGQSRGILRTLETKDGLEVGPFEVMAGSVVVATIAGCALAAP